MRHVLSTSQFDRESLLELFEKALEMEELMLAGKRSNLMEDKIMATLFFEPSTRTRFSFETAMYRLGGRVISNADMMSTSSVKKLESLEDTGKTVSQMADLIVMRHPEKGSVRTLAMSSDVPVINAGDGAGEHPTQALLDLYTIWKSHKKLDGLTIGMIGDLKNGRVPHSQCDLLKHFDVRFVFVAPKALRMPEDVMVELKTASLEVTEMEDLPEALPKMDVIAMTRIQKERFDSEKEYKKYAGSYVLNADLMALAKRDAILIHPLPRVDEITPELDNDPRSKYFEQVKNGVAVRMALICKVFEL